MNSQQTEQPAFLRAPAESAASIAVGNALARIRAGDAELAVDQLQHALLLLADPHGAVEQIVLDAERFREFAEATVRDDGMFENAVLSFPAKDEQTSSLDYFRALVDFATKEQYADNLPQGLAS